MDDKPSSAISVRIENKDQKGAERQRRHDLRSGPQPSYIDPDRANLNTTILSPRPGSALRRLCEDRRATRETKRSMKSNASVASYLIITFGSDAQPIFEALSVEDQDRAYRAVSDRVAAVLGVELTGLVAHRDESSPHAHGQMPSFHPDGRSLSQIMTPAIAARLQDVAAEEIARFAPGIVRGVRKADRVARGEKASRIYHRSVRELHQDLPRELEEARARVVEMRDRVTTLEGKAELSEREIKGLATYGARLDDRQHELDETESRLGLEVAAADALRVAAEAEAILVAAQIDADQVRAEAHQTAALEVSAIHEAAREEGRREGREEVVGAVRHLDRQVASLREELRNWLQPLQDLGRAVGADLDLVRRARLVLKEGADWLRRLDGIRVAFRRVASGNYAVGQLGEMQRSEDVRVLAPVRAIEAAEQPWAGSDDIEAEASVEEPGEDAEPGAR